MGTIAVIQGGYDDCLPRVVERIMEISDGFEDMNEHMVLSC